MDNKNLLGNCDTCVYSEFSRGDKYKCGFLLTEVGGDNTCDEWLPLQLDVKGLGVQTFGLLSGEIN